MPGIVLESVLPRLPMPDVATGQRTSELAINAKERVRRWIEDIAFYRANHVLRDSDPPPIEMKTNHVPYSRGPIHHGYTTRVGISPLAQRVPPAVSAASRGPISLRPQLITERYSPDGCPQWAWPYHSLSNPSPLPFSGMTSANNKSAKVYTPSTLRETAKDSAALSPPFSKVICPPRPRTNNGPERVVLAVTEIKGSSALASPDDEVIPCPPPPSRRRTNFPAFVYRPGTYSLALAPEGDEMILIPAPRRDVGTIARPVASIKNNVYSLAPGHNKGTPVPPSSNTAVVQEQTAGKEPKHSSALASSDGGINPVSSSQHPRSETVSTQPERTRSDKGTSSSASTPNDGISLDSQVRKGSAVDAHEGDGSYITCTEGTLAQPPRSTEGPYEHLFQTQKETNIRKTTGFRMEELNALEDQYALQLLPRCLEELDILV